MPGKAKKKRRRKNRKSAKSRKGGGKKRKRGKGKRKKKKKRKKKGRKQEKLESGIADEDTRYKDRSMSKIVEKPTVFSIYLQYPISSSALFQNRERLRPC